MPGLNSLHYTLMFLTGVFFFLYYIFPRKREIAWLYFRLVTLGMASLLILAPFFWLACSAFKDKSVLMEYTFLPPLSKCFSTDYINLDNFKRLFAGDDTLQGKVYFWQYIVNSLFLASASTVIQLFFATLGGYALAVYDFRGKKIIMGYMLLTLVFPGILLLAPVYELIFQIGWMDTYWALLVPGAVSVFGMFLFRQAMIQVPKSLIEAARIDGCSEFAIYYNVAVPLVRPMIGAFCLICFLGSWNTFIGPQVFLQTNAKLTLPVILNQYIGVYTQQYGVFLAGTLLAIIPPIIIFFALQKEFISGLSTGAIKG